MNFPCESYSSVLCQAEHMCHDVAFVSVVLPFVKRPSFSPGSGCLPSLHGFWLFSVCIHGIAEDSIIINYWPRCYYVLSIKAFITRHISHVIHGRQGKQSVTDMLYTIRL